MAAIENIEGDLFNVNAKVGKRGSNLTGDVTLIQALLKYIRPEGGQPGYEFAPGLPPLREPDGIYIPGELDSLITKYQTFMNALNHRSFLKVDGVISRARGKVSWGQGKYWTIIQLNDDCERVRYARGEDDHISAITKRFPQVAVALAIGN